MSHSKNSNSGFFGINPIGFLIRLYYAVLRGKAIKADPQIRQVLSNMDTMTEWEKSKFLRITIRVANGDKRVMRYHEMYEKGLITRRQFLEAM